MIDSDMQEMKDRLRRIETRLTNYMESRGHNTGAIKPMWVAQGNAIHIAGLGCSFGDMLKVIPEGLAFRGDITIVCKGIRIGVMYIDPHYTVAK